MTKNRSNPINSIAMSFGKALLVDLKNPKPWGIVPQDCKTTMFQQVFESGHDILPEETIEDVVVVQGPSNDVCVYRSGYLLYKVEKPNEKFFDDLKNCQLQLKPVEYGGVMRKLRLTRKMVDGDILKLGFSGGKEVVAIIPLECSGETVIIELKRIVKELQKWNT